MLSKSDWPITSRTERPVGLCKGCRGGFPVDGSAAGAPISPPGATPGASAAGAPINGSGATVAPGAVTPTSAGFKGPALGAVGTG